MGVLGDRSSFHGFWGPVVAAFVTGIFSTMFLIVFGQAKGVVPSPGTPTATATTTVTATVTAPSVPSPDPSATSVTYLEALDPVEDNELERAAATLGDVEYLQSLTNPMASCSEVGPVAWVLPGDSQRVLAEVGVAKDAAEPQARVAFLVRVDSNEVFSKALDVGQHEPLNVSVEGGSRLTIESRFIPEGGFRGNCNTEATAVWGDLRVMTAG